MPYHFPLTICCTWCLWEDDLCDILLYRLAGFTAYNLTESELINYEMKCSGKMKALTRGFEPGTFRTTHTWLHGLAQATDCAVN